MHHRRAPLRNDSIRQPRPTWLLVSLLLLFTSLSQSLPVGHAQPPELDRLPADQADQIVGADEIRSVLDETPETAPVAAEPSGIDLLSLIARGGTFMIPILLMSFLVVTLSVERALSLRQGKILPRRLRNELGRATKSNGEFDPVAAYQACRRYDSPAGRVIASMLLRTGQPLGDIERTASETAQREADRYAAPIRWLNLAAAATPLMGLLGTVWGMIVAFHESASLSPDQSRSEQLSEGIYTALVTTLAGLVVAIPAAVLAQHFENRLTKLFHRVEQFAFDVAPSLSPFAGRSRLDADGKLKPFLGTSSTRERVANPQPATAMAGRKEGKARDESKVR